MPESERDSSMMGLGYIPDESFHERRRGLFIKASYLWRL